MYFMIFEYEDVIIGNLLKICLINKGNLYDLLIKFLVFRSFWLFFFFLNIL